jgi:hypothetical protein
VRFEMSADYVPPAALNRGFASDLWSKTTQMHPRSF